MRNAPVTTNLCPVCSSSTSRLRGYSGSSAREISVLFWPGGVTPVCLLRRAQLRDITQRCSEWHSACYGCGESGHPAFSFLTCQLRLTPLTTRRCWTDFVRRWASTAQHLIGLSPISLTDKHIVTIREGDYSESNSCRLNVDGYPRALFRDLSASPCRPSPCHSAGYCVSVHGLPEAMFDTNMTMVSTWILCVSRRGTTSGTWQDHEVPGQRLFWEDRPCLYDIAAGPQHALLTGITGEDTVSKLQKVRNIAARVVIQIAPILKVIHWF